MANHSDLAAWNGSMATCLANKTNAEIMQQQNTCKKFLEYMRGISGIHARHRLVASEDVRKPIFST